MSNATIKVASVAHPEVKTKFGLKNVTDVVDENGTEWHFGFVAAAKDLTPGDVVSVQYVDNNYGHQVKQFEKAGEGTPTSAPTEVKAAAGSVGAVGLARERAIIRQNSVTNAVALLEAMAAFKEMKDAFLADPAAFATGIVDDIARVFEAYCTGDMDKKRAAEKAASGDE